MYRTLVGLFFLLLCFNFIKLLSNFIIILSLLIIFILSFIKQTNYIAKKIEIINNRSDVK
jgi:hypothetical protein